MRADSGLCGELPPNSFLPEIISRAERLPALKVNEVGHLSDKLRWYRVNYAL